jgi:carbonic anhydrase/acetyltransferase-like protein (isoleucine patch superfamily)
VIGRDDGVAQMATDESPNRPRVERHGAMFIQHRRHSPRVAETAYVAPTAVVCGDVVIGPHSRVLFGAVVTAEGGPVEIGANCVIMENAVVRGVPGHRVRLGDHVLVGPHAHLTGCVVEGGTRIATGAVVFTGALLGVGAEVDFHAVVHVNTVLPDGTSVPMGWFAGGNPAELVPPGDHDRIRALMGPLDYPGTVFGIGDTATPFPDMARRYARGLALHRYDRILPTEQHPELLAVDTRSEATASTAAATTTTEPADPADPTRRRPAPKVVRSDRL